MNERDAKLALDKIIRKSRVHFYKPIQIAEILYHNRIGDLDDLSDLESYRNISKGWRDEVSSTLVGRRSTSSQKYQDNLFEANAVPPDAINKLAKLNKKTDGGVEVFIYSSLQARLSSVEGVANYVKSATPDTFAVADFVGLFQKSPGLKRSVDKMYEIIVYALFTTITRALKVTVKMEIQNRDSKILKDFSSFLELVLGLKSGETNIIMPAALYRVGVTNAADKGLDMWANFGPAIQVKHLTLTGEIVEDIGEDIKADKVVIVCLDAERIPIDKILKQLGWVDRIQGIVTLKDLEAWAAICMGVDYRDALGQNLLAALIHEFLSEFPTTSNIKPFIAQRGYDKLPLPGGWRVLV